MAFTCARCGGPIERVEHTDPFWRHTDMADLVAPHGAVPANATD